MKFYGTWRSFLKESQHQQNKLLIEQFLNEQAEFLLESRKQEAKDKFPDAADEVDDMYNSLREQFGNAGSKYLMYSAWALSTHNSDFSDTLDILILFHQKSKRLSKAVNSKANSIGWWMKEGRTPEDLKQAIEDLPETSGERKRRIKASASEFIYYNKDGITAVVPFSEETHCKWGRNPGRSSWCISHKSNLEPGGTSHPVNYAKNKQEFFAYIIFDEKVSKNPTPPQHRYGQFALHWRPMCNNDGEPVINSETGTRYVLSAWTDGSNSEFGRRHPFSNSGNIASCSQFIEAAIKRHNPKLDAASIAKKLIAPGAKVVEEYEVPKRILRKSTSGITTVAEKYKKIRSELNEIRKIFQGAARGQKEFTESVNSAVGQLDLSKLQSTADSDCAAINEKIKQKYTWSTSERVNRYQPLAYISCKVVAAPELTSALSWRDKDYTTQTNIVPETFGNMPEAPLRPSGQGGIYGHFTHAAFTRGLKGKGYRGTDDETLGPYLPNWKDGKWKTFTDAELEDSSSLIFTKASRIAERSSMLSVAPHACIENPKFILPPDDKEYMCWFIKRITLSSGKSGGSIYEHIKEYIKHRVPSYSDFSEASSAIGQTVPVAKGIISVSWSVSVAMNKLFDPKYNHKLYGCLREQTETIDSVFLKDLNDKWAVWLKKTAESMSSDNLLRKIEIHRALVENYDYKIIQNNERVALTATTKASILKTNNSPHSLLARRKNEIAQTDVYEQANLLNNSTAVIFGHVASLADPDLFETRGKGFKQYSDQVGMNVENRRYSEHFFGYWRPDNLSAIQMPKTNYHPDGLGYGDVIHNLNEVGELFEQFLISNYENAGSTWDKIDAKESKKTNKDLFYEQVHKQVLNKPQNNGRRITIKIK